MKRIFRTLSLIAGVILSCAAFSAPVGAATLVNQFTTSDGAVSFSVEDVAKFQFGGGQITQVFSDGNCNGALGICYLALPDASGNVAAKIKANAYFVAHFIYNSANGYYYNPSSFKSVICDATNGTTIRYLGNAAERLNDGCTFWQTVKANSN